MKESKHTRIWLITGLIFTLFTTHLPVVYTLFYHEITGASSSVNGSTDLAAMSTDKSIVLDGKWEFYWNRFIVTKPRQEDKPDLFIRVPDYWSRYKIGGNFLPAEGFASYRLTLYGLSDSKPVTVYLPDFGSAYRVFLDGELVAESGVVSENNSEVFTTPKAKLYPVTLSVGEEHELVIETATTRFSGLYMAPVLQDYVRAMGEESNRGDIRFILFGIVLFSLFILSVLYGLSFRRGMRSTWLPVLILCVLLRLMLTTEFYGFWQSSVFFNLNYEDTNDLMFLATFALKFLLIFLFQEQFGITFSRREKIGFFLYYTAIYLAHLFIPHGIYNRHLTVLLPASTFLLEFYSYFKVYFGWEQLKKFGLPIYWGTVLAISGLIIDSYYINGNSYLNLTLALMVSLSAYLVILSLMYALRVVDVYNNLAVSSARLVLARNQIAMQTEYYDALSSKINEVRAVRHDVRHFVGVIKQLLNEGRYEELKRFLDEYGEKAETDPLPVFCENIVVNSILGYYSLKAKENGVSFRCACAIPKLLSVSDTDLCTVLSNALENAIEACRKLESPDARFLSVKARNLNGQLLIKIENSYNGCLKLRNSGYLTTKSGDFHGIGLKNIQKVAQICGGFIKIKHDDKIFTLMAAFPNPSEVKESPADTKTD